LVGVEQWAEIGRMHFVAGLSIEEIARRTEPSPATPAHTLTRRSNRSRQREAGEQARATSWENSVAYGDLWLWWRSTRMVDARLYSLNCAASGSGASRTTASSTASMVCGPGCDAGSPKIVRILGTLDPDTSDAASMTPSSRWPRAVASGNGSGDGRDTLPSMLRRTAAGGGCAGEKRPPQFRNWLHRTTWRPALASAML
jgi:hypothetical protein